jgi:collagenase-like PrtC family protease
LPLPVASDWQALLNPQWPKAQWDVSGAFTFDGLFLLLHDFMMKQTGLKPFSQVHGAPTCKWNGGRLKTNIFSQDTIDGLIKSYSDRGMAVHATFTNYNITESLLEDSLGNLILECLQRHNQTGNNGVILSDELLASYVRAKHPSLKLIASVTKIAKEKGRGKVDYYRSLEAAYDRIMIHPDDNLHPEVLAQLENKAKYEVLINEPCIRNCQQRVYHYQMLSDGHTDFLDYSMTKRLIARLSKNDCENIRRLTISPSDRTLILSTSELKGIYDLGFRNFKIQGRGMTNDQAMLFELSRWLFTRDPSLDYLIPRLMMAFMSPAP